MTRLRALALLVCCLVWKTPVFAATLTVNAGGNLQSAIDAAQPGDTIVLQAGATFTGPFTLRAKNGTAYITIRSSTPDSQLPPAGTRISPAYAPLLAKIKPGVSGSAIRTVPGASYWRLQFLEVLPSGISGGQTVGTLIEFGSGGSTNQSSLSQVPHHLIIDRCYVHGHPSLGHRRGLALNSGNSEVRDSYFSDFKLVGFDTQAILGWNGPGPYVIENNHLEAAGENVMFGGADPKIANLVPSNITLRRNLFTKPTAWKTQSWALINLLELKNAQDLTIEGNIFENNWLAGAVGYAIAITPRNQEGTAPWSVVRNLTFQNNVVRHVAGVFNITGYDNLHPSRQTENIVISNNLAYDVNPIYTTKSSTPAEGRFMLIGAGPKNIKIRHNTVDNQGSGTMVLYKGQSPTGPLIYEFELTSNLLRANTYGILGAEGQGVGTAVFNAFTPNAVVLRNAIAGADPKAYPTGNDYPSLATWLADFVDRASADYQLKSTSLSNNAGVDGTDIGVNFTELNAALGGSSPPPPPPPPPPTGLSPYSGTPIGLPGTVEAEHYDRGGEGVAYHDTTPGNKDGVFRPDDVDLQIATDTGGGYKVKSAVASEWLKYSVNVAAAGTYTITVRVASAGAGGRFHIEAGGTDKTGPLTVADTGGWQSWQTITKSGVTLSAGPQTLSLVLDSNGASGMTGNFNWIGVVRESTPYSGTPVALPGTIQAENYDLGGEGIAYHDTTPGNKGGVYRPDDDVDLQDAVDTGGGFKVKTAVAGEWLNYTVNVMSAGTYTLTARVSSSGAGGRFHIEVNGVDRTGPIDVPDTGDWQTWLTLSKTGITLAAGRQVIRLVLDTNGANGLTGNFNWIGVQ